MISPSVTCLISAGIRDRVTSVEDNLHVNLAMCDKFGIQSIGELVPFLLLDQSKEVLIEQKWVMER